ncbi:helicase SNF2 [Mycobacterium sp. IEC1808]|uniref:DEAD/DEAH box helicase n=1 Tax=Mycobacterium sp. IEC1808 TaxID=1743230 RepID=UPI000A162A03|nr:DEAD/DEAH box helicase [Mycobacterium sp. IEC1808]ORW93960.1 helicase SNF2 [Mycobacterium sp. IEC1808]
MNREERQQLRLITDEVAAWTASGTQVRAQRRAVAEASLAARDALRGRIVEVGEREGEWAWRVLPLYGGDTALLRDLAGYDALPTISNDFLTALKRLTTEVPAALRDVRALTGATRFLRGVAARDRGTQAAQFLTAFRDYFVGQGMAENLAELVATRPAEPRPITVTDALADRVGLGMRLADLGSSPQLLAAKALTGLPEAIAKVQGALAEDARCRDAAMEAGTAVRRAETQRLIAGMPVDRLKEATRERIRTAPLTDAGLRTVADVLRSPALHHLPGIGEVSATRIKGAAQTLWQTTYEEMPVRIDIRNRSASAAALLRQLRVWDAVRKSIGTATDLDRAKGFAPLGTALYGPVVCAVVLCAAGRTVAQFEELAHAVVEQARLMSDARAAARGGDVWEDFLGRPADYFALLAELGFITEDAAKAHGDLPDEIVAAVRAQDLRTDYLLASLRGYQSFGARFALVQRKVILGDEMGLGKTVEAIAVLAHLRAKGSQHFLVICPAAVVTNWMREVASKSKLRPHRLHGYERGGAVRAWARNGGVAITTFETLPWLHDQRSVPSDIGCVVVDEAHYIKNPEAARTRNSRVCLDGAEWAVLLTGTPLENRIEEFRNLVLYLQPKLVIDADELAPRKFRRQVAPAYLRRNQEDVLTELPGLVEVDEWLVMSNEDAAAYRDAVQAGNFMAMRQAAMIQGGMSSKMQRLIELVKEAEDNGRRVVVFSYFRNVLDRVAREMPGRVFGPLTGSVPAHTRQAMVDEFSGAGHGAVLVAQIVAGGVGLNIQAASVVVICEPQVKPTMEWQAVARARRMGQLESVQVHRLLSEEGVDQRIREILARKRELFEDFARRSATADSAPEAYDISEAELAREVVAAERERLFGQTT